MAARKLDRMVPLPFPLAGSTLVLGPSNAGKTTLTARALEQWIDANGPDGVTVLEFGPEYEHGGRILGRRLSRFVRIPNGVWHGVLEARAPRAESASDVEASHLAFDNAERASRILDAAPVEPRAVFVNDATIPFGHDRGDPRQLTAYCDQAICAVVNAFESDELGVNDQVSQCERVALEVFENWAERVIRLGASD